MGVPHRINRRVQVSLNGLVRAFGDLAFTSAVFDSAFFSIPSLADERAAYDLFGWARTGSDETFTFGSGVGLDLNLMNLDAHDDTENDDLWTWRQQKARGYTDPKIDEWIATWRAFYLNTTAAVPPNNFGGYQWQYGVGIGHRDDDGGDHDHGYAAGAVLRYVLDGDTVALNGAITIGDNSINEFTVSHDMVTPPNPVTFDNTYHRALARWTIIWAYLYKATGTAKWLTFLNAALDCYTQSTSSWSESPTVGIVSGAGFYHWSRNDCNVTSYTAGQGSHPSNTLVDANRNSSQADYDNGRRFNSTFFTGLIGEALWRGYKVTGRLDVREKLVKLARFVQNYGHVATHTVPLAGSYIGVDNTYSTHVANGGVYKRSPQYGNFLDSNDNSASCTYDAALVNVLVRGYKLTGDAALLTRARVHLRQCRKWAVENQPGSSHVAPAVPDNQVLSFMDVVRNGGTGVDQALFHYNKGQLQYTYAIFENGGVPATEAGATWTPSYASILPTVDGQIVAVAGDLNGSINPWPSGPAIPYWSAYPTNCPGDVRPAEIGAKYFNMAINNESHLTWLPDYSPGGAIGGAGMGGHNGEDFLGAYLFDITDLRHKRIWTTQGNPGVDNVAGLTGTGPDSDVRSNTRVHNILSYTNQGLLAQVIECFEPQKVWDPARWTPLSWQLAQVDLAADPRNQKWEMTWKEEPGGAYPYSATIQRDPTGNIIMSGPDGVPTSMVGQTNWDQGTGMTGRLGDSKRFTVLPKPSTVPIPAHCWDTYFPVSAAFGGGPLSNVGVGRHAAAGSYGTSGCAYSHQFNLHTGMWSQLALNSNTTSLPTESPTVASIGTPVCGVFDDRTNRFYMTPQLLTSNPGRLNYFSLDDKLWRQLGVGSSAVAITTANCGRCDNVTLDKDRNIILIMTQNGRNSGVPLRLFDLSTVDATPGSHPSAGSGGWQCPPVTIAFTIPTDPQYGTSAFEAQWVYYPPNGKYYRYIRIFGDPGSTAQPQGAFNKLERLTPPPVGQNPFTGNWTWDEITFDLPVNNATPLKAGQCPNGWMAHGGRQLNQRRWPKRLKYVPTLQLLIWYPHDAGGENDPATRNPVYLIKPY